jgi:23S rRNA pseudouridine2605 synthase
VVTTASDEKGRATVYELIKSREDWVGPVGRLDKASEGLLLLTNDSKWAAKITDPASHLEKKYHVQVDCVAGDDLLVGIRRGVNVGEEHLSVKAARVLRVGGKNSWLEISLDEGKNRQIRRLLEGLGVHALRLVRVSVGPLELGDLKKGSVRTLTDEEKRLVDRALDSRSG